MKIRTGIRVSSLTLFLMFLLACGANESVLRSGNETPVQANTVNEKTPFAQDFDAMRTAGFTFIYILRRKDSGTLETEDISVIKLQTADTNRRVKTDNDRAVIIGSNKEIPKENLDVLYARFAVENFSEPPVVDANVNVNANK
ncbi:MAG: hypothetical protein ACKVRN_07630 [Pyrinomonadaceae bacterium]